MALCYLHHHHHLLLFLLPILFTSLTQASTSKLEDSTTCSPEPGSPVIRFPFGLNDDIKSQTYPGFTLKCNRLSQTVLTFPHSGDFIVEEIDYQLQSVYIRDPGGCLPARYKTNFTLAGTPYLYESYREFTFLTCPSNFTPSQPGLRVVPCLSKSNYTVVALPASRLGALADAVSSCTQDPGSSVVPVPWPPWSDAETTLVWGVPDCRACESRGGTCGFKQGSGDSGLDVGCSDLPASTGLPRGAKYGIALGAGIPGVLFIICSICYLTGRIQNFVRRRRRPADVAFSNSITLQPSVALSGLDEPTIESYPKTLLGESKRLPKPSETACSICLCEYQPKETLRTIPECNHFFHADCIDEWLRLNATCPLCRNSPEASSRCTPVSSLSLSSSSSSPSPSAYSSSSRR